jgi:hypothetical protein
MKVESVAILLGEMAVGIILGFIAWSYLGPVLGAPNS